MTNQPDLTVTLNHKDEVECESCEASIWSLQASGRVRCGICGYVHPHIAWFDDAEDVIAQLSDVS